MLKGGKRKLASLGLVLVVLGCAVYFTSRSEVYGTTDVPLVANQPSQIIEPEVSAQPDVIAQKENFPVDTGIITSKYVKDGQYTITIKWHEPDEIFNDETYVVTEEEFFAMPPIGGSLNRLY